MNTYPPRITHVRPELECMAEYHPGESLESFSTRTGIPIDRLIKLNSNESPFGPVPSVLNALGDYRNYNGYPDTNATALRTALSAYTELDSRYIVLSHGSSELINLLWHIFLAVGDTIISCTPTFSLYTSVTTFCGASVIEVPRTVDYEVDVESVFAALTPSTKLIVLCSPNNPTGNPIAPVVKISTNTELAERMSDIIDFDAGSIIRGSATVEQVGEQILDRAIEIASGAVSTKAESLAQDDFIPWKRGVSL